MILDGLSLKDKKIIINSKYDLFKDCYFMGCEIVADHPLSIYMAIIRNPKREVKNIAEVEESAISIGCFFEACDMPDAHYDGCYFKGNSSRVDDKI